MDNKKRPFMFTIWDDLADHEGTELARHLYEHPVILAKRVVVSEYRKVRRVATRYSSTISINPPYTQAIALMNWAGDNDQMLMTYTLRSSSTSCSALNLAPIEDEVVSISAIPTMSSTVQMFFIEGNISLPDRFQSYYLLACSNCNHFVRLPRCLIFFLHNTVASSCHKSKCSLLKATYPCLTDFNHTTCLHARTAIILSAVKHTERSRVSNVSCKACQSQGKLFSTHLNDLLSCRMITAYMSGLEKEIPCSHCRCYFEVDITNNSGTLTAVVPKTLAETMLSMTAEQVYDTVATKVNIVKELSTPHNYFSSS